MSSALTHLIDERATVAKKKLTVTREFTIDYHVRSPYGRWENIHKNKEQKLPRLGFLTSLVVDPRIGSITHPLAEEQRQLLRRGPTYVSPCQMHLAPSLSTMDDLVRKQYAPLQHQMALLFSRYNIDISRQENIKCQIKKEFKDLFSRAIPDDIRARASNERDVSRSLRATLKKNNWMLRRTADHLTGFYLGPRLYFDQKCYEYLNESDCYHVLFTVDEHNRDRVRQEVASKAHGLNSELETMHKQKRLTKEVYERLRVNVNHISLPYLYFLPELSTVSGAFFFFFFFYCFWSFLAPRTRTISSQSSQWFAPTTAPHRKYPATCIDYYDRWWLVPWITVYLRTKRILFANWFNIAKLSTISIQLRCSPPFTSPTPSPSSPIHRSSKRLPTSSRIISRRINCNTHRWWPIYHNTSPLRLWQNWPSYFFDTASSTTKRKSTGSAKVVRTVYCWVTTYWISTCSSGNSGSSTMSDWKQNSVAGTDYFGWVLSRKISLSRLLSLFIPLDITIRSF